MSKKCPEKLSLPDLCTCDYGDTDRVIDYLMVISRKINEIIDYLGYSPEKEKIMEKIMGICPVCHYEDCQCKPETLEDVIFDSELYSAASEYMPHGNTKMAMELVSAIRKFMKESADDLIVAESLNFMRSKGIIDLLTILGIEEDK